MKSVSLKPEEGREEERPREEANDATSDFSASISSWLESEGFFFVFLEFAMAMI